MVQFEGLALLQKYIFSVYKYAIPEKLVPQHFQVCIFCLPFKKHSISGPLINH